MKQIRKLLIDDTRDEASPEVLMAVDCIARNYWEGIRQLTLNGPWDLLLLDHDLHSYDEKQKEWTGYDIACLLEELTQNGHLNLVPKEIRCVSSNPEGKRRIEVVLLNIKEMRKEQNG